MSNVHDINAPRVKGNVVLPPSQRREAASPPTEQERRKAQLKAEMSVARNEGSIKKDGIENISGTMKAIPAVGALGLTALISPPVGAALGIGALVSGCPDNRHKPLATGEMSPEPVASGSEPIKDDPPSHAVTEEGEIEIVPAVAEEGEIEIVPAVAEEGEIEIVPAVAEEGEIEIVPAVAAEGEIEIVPAVSEEGEAVTDPDLDRIMDDIERGDFSSFRSAPESVRTDRPFLLAAISKNADFYDLLPQEFRNDDLFIYDAISLNSPLIMKNPDYLEDPLMVLAALGEMKEIQLPYYDLLEAVANHYGSADNPIFNDREFAHWAVICEPVALEWLTAFQADEAIALEAIKHDAYAINYVDASLIGSPAFMEKAIFANNTIHYFFKPGFLDPSDIPPEAEDAYNAYIAVSQGESIENYPQYCGNRDFVMAAAGPINDGWDNAILPYAADDLKNDKDFVMTLMRSCPDEYQYLSDEMKADEQICLEYVKYSDIPQAIPESLSKNREFMLQAAAMNGMVLSRHKDFKSDEEVAMQAVSQNGMSVGFIPNGIVRARSDIVLAAVRQNGNAYLILKHPIYGALTDEPHDRNLIMEAAKTASDHYSLYSSLPEEYQNDEEIVLTMLARSNINPEFILDTEIAKNEEFLVKAVQSNINLYKHITSPSAIVTDAYNRMKEALGVLKILVDEEGPRTCQVNDCRDIIRNRYAAASQEVRSRLEELLGAGYFEGADQDDRPVCIISYPVEDLSGSFWQSNSTNFSRASNNYRVLFYNAESNEEFERNLMETSTLGQADYLVIGGHGSQSSIQQGLAVKELSPGLTKNDTRWLYKLNDVVKNYGTIILKSCSTGEDEYSTSGINNMAEFFHKVWPRSFLFAPTSGSMTSFEFKADGTIQPDYGIGVKSFIIPPDDLAKTMYWMFNNR